MKAEKPFGNLHRLSCSKTTACGTANHSTAATDVLLTYYCYLGIMQQRNMQCRTNATHENTKHTYIFEECTYDRRTTFVVISCIFIIYNLPVRAIGLGATLTVLMLTRQSTLTSGLLTLMLGTRTTVS